MTISYIYKLGNSGQIERTYAYTKLEDNLFLTVAVSWNFTDKNEKKTARSFAKAKLEMILNLLKKTEGKLVAKGKYFHKHLTFDELSELKAKVLWNNTIISTITKLQSHLRKGYRAAAKASDLFPKDC